MPRRAEARQGYMFSTAKAMPVDSSSAAIPWTNPRRSPAASGTAGAPRPRRRRRRAAISADRSSLPHGSVPQTRWVISRHGACTAQTGISWWSESCLSAAVCWLSASMPTITSTAS